MMLSLRDQNAVRQQLDLAAMYDPRSPSFMHFNTAAGYASKYGAAPEEAKVVQGFLRAGGLKAEWSPGDSWVTVTGPTDSADRVFHVSIHDYLSPRGIRYYASRQDPTVPASLRNLVISAGHISSFAQPSVKAVPAGGLKPVDLLQAYDISPLRSLNFDGRGETVVFIEPGVNSYNQSNLDAFTTQFHLPPIHVADRGANAQHGQGGSTGQRETEMDLEVVHAIAPAANLVVYTLPSDSSSNQVVFDIQKSAVDENPGAIISQSWGWCEPAWGSALVSSTGDLYNKADMLGESVFVSSGDSGAYSCLEAVQAGTAPSDQYLTGELPCTAPGVTCVGGTRISVRADGSYYNETVWEEPPLTGGGGGGLSQAYPLPAWQVGPGVSNRYSTGMREFPDISADADPHSGAAVYVGGVWETGGGTSQSAPILAGITAVVDQFLKQQGLKSIGFANPALYALAAHPGTYPAFHDVVVGTNLYYPATPGYDLATGLGTPDVWNLARDLVAYQRSGG